VSKEDLRHRARERMTLGRTDIDHLSRKDIQELVYELQLHQAELEITNEELRTAQNEVIEARDRYAALYDFAPVGYLTLDENHTIQQANQTAAKLFDRARRDLEGLAFPLLAKPEDRDACHLFLRRIRPGSPDTVELRFLGAEGGTFWVRILATCLEAQDSRCRGFRVAVSNITSEKEGEALRLSEQRYRFLYEESPAINIVIALDGLVLDINRQATLAIGYRKDEVVGRPMTDFVVPEQREFVAAMLQSTAQGKKPSPESDIAILARNGEVRRFMIVAGTEVFFQDGKPTGYLFSALDITERLRLEQELKRKAGELALTNKELEAFVYSVSHDLRGPLRAISGFADILRDEYQGSLDDTAKDYFKRISQGVDKMRHLIDDLLRLSRISRRELHLDTVNLSEMATGLLQDIQSQSPRKDAQITVAQGILAEADADLIRIALDNILQNAWKYTSKNANTIIEFGRLEEQGAPVFFVRDNGVGFAQEFAQRVFEPFKRLQGERDFPGTGIGLAIVKRIFDKHGGSIWAKSEPGKGAAFYFTLPCREPQQ